MRKANKPLSSAPRLKTIVKAQASDEGFYVPVSFVTKLTGWDYRMMEYLRDNHLITFRNTGGVLLYRLDSVYKIWSEMKKFQRV